MAHTEENVLAVDELVLSQEDQPQSHHSTLQIAWETGLAQASVVLIIHRDIGLKCFKRRRGQELNEANRQARLSRSKMLLAKYSESDVNFMWSTDEKVFTVAMPRNSQNDRLYAAASTTKKHIPAKHLLRTWSTFSRLVMVSVGISKLGVTQLMFVDPGVKIDGAYYRNVLLSQQLLPAIRQISGEFFIFQQDSSPAHRARDTINLLERDTPAFISSDLWPPNSTDLNPVNYKVWALCSTEFTRQRSRIWTIWSAVRLTCVLVYSRAFSMMPSTSGVNVSTPAFEPEVDTSNIRSDSRISQTLRTLIHSINVTF